MYYFFGDYKAAYQVANQSKVTIRKMHLTNADIARRAWQYLFNEFLKLEPVNPAIYEAIKTSMPAGIKKDIFKNKLMIETVLERKNIHRHQYDYRVSRLPNKHLCAMPSFSELIKEVRHADH